MCRAEETCGRSPVGATKTTSTEKMTTNTPIEPPKDEGNELWENGPRHTPSRSIRAIAVRVMWVRLRIRRARGGALPGKMGSVKVRCTWPRVPTARAVECQGSARFLRKKHVQIQWMGSQFNMKQVEWGLHCSICDWFLHVSAKHKPCIFHLIHLSLPASLEVTDQGGDPFFVAPGATG